MSNLNIPTIQDIQVTLLRASGLAAVIGYAAQAQDYIAEDKHYSPAPCDFKAAAEVLTDLIQDASAKLDTYERFAEKKEDAA